MVIDFHNHLGIDLGAELSQTADELIARMDEAAIALAVIFPFPGCPDLAAGNATVWDAAARYSDRLIPFLGVNPREHRNQSADELTAYLNERAAHGIIIDPMMHHFSLRHAIVDPLMQACATLHLSVMIQLIGQGQEDCSPMVELAARHPEVTVIVSPLVYCPGWATIAKAQPNLYADTAKPMRPGHIVQLVNALGAERVLFGSETPYMSPLVEREKFRYTDLSEETQEQILSGNAERLLSVVKDAA